MLKTEHYVAITLVTVTIITIIVWVNTQNSKSKDSTDMDTSSDFASFDETKNNKSDKSPLLLIVVVIISIAVVGGAYWYFFGNEETKSKSTKVIVDTPLPPPPPPPPPSPSPPPPSPSPPQAKPPVGEAYQKHFEVDESILEETKPELSSTSELTRYVRLEKTILNSNMSSQLYLNIAEVEVYDESGKNVAQGKQAYQISTAPANSFWNPQNTCRKASCAVDGDVNGDWFSTGDKVSTNSITHTYLKPTQNNKKWDLLAKKDTVWWEVDLGSEHKVNVVKVFNRTDMASDRMKHTRVILLDSNKQALNSFLLEDERSVYEIHV